MAYIPPEKPIEEALAKPVGEALSNVSAPISKNVGTTLANIWSLVFGGIDQYAEKRRMKYASELKNYEKELNNEINHIPEESRIEPNTHTVMKALSESQYCVEEPELRGMFCKLIASTVDKDRAGDAHPSFSNIISRMSPFDAQLLKKLSGNHSWPIAQYRQVYSDDKGYIILNTNLLAIDSCVVEPLDAVASSLDVLASLGLIALDYMTNLTRPGAYDAFSSYAPYTNRAEKSRNNANLDYAFEVQKGLLKITDLGQRFIKACVR